MMNFTAIISYLFRSTQKYTLKYTFYQEYQNVSKVFITFEGIEPKSLTTYLCYHFLPVPLFLHGLRFRELAGE